MRPDAYSRFCFDKRPGGEKSFVQARKAERYYGAQLRKIARHVGELIGIDPPADLMQSFRLKERLRKYSEAITPWASSVAERMLADVSRRDRDAWRARSAEMGRLLRTEIAEAPTGHAMRRLLGEQVGLITSLPTEAGERVHRLVQEGMVNSTRASEISREIMRSGEVAESRARTIARTEVGRAATTLTQVRAESVGSEGYIWRIADRGARPSHKAMEGKFVRWDSPPTLDGLRGHAGCLPNCRCLPEPVLPGFFAVEI
jgi:SPP1 gp7 family putative phage head morphogenesis protein